MKVTAIRFAADNYAYWVQRIGSAIGFMLDTGSAPELLSFLKSKDLPKPMHILSTHKHSDHCGGNIELLAPGGKIYAGEKDAPEVPGCTTALKNGETFDIDGLKITTFHTPCHTVGSVLYYVKANELPNEKIYCEVKHTDKDGSWAEYSGGLNRAVFTGDTLFVAGCGRFFEGTASEMLDIMDKLKEFPDDLAIFCGHEYAFSSAKFGMQVEPENPHIKALLERSAESENGEFILPSSIGEEKLFNVFMRCKNEEVQKAVGSEDPVFCMNTLRTTKNKGAFKSAK